jgi:hypothetical protein
MNHTSRAASPLMTTTVTAAALGISKVRLAAMRRTATGPTYYELGHWIIRYNRASIDRWLLNNRTGHPARRDPLPEPPQRDGALAHGRLVQPVALDNAGAVRWST